MDTFIGNIQMFGFNFAPRGWAQCNGQLLPISQNQALFSLIGTFYGGDGRTTFALPDLRGRVPMHEGTGPGLSPNRMGQRSGAETTTLSVLNLPSHNHTAAFNLGNAASGTSLSGGFIASTTAIPLASSAVSSNDLNSGAITIGNTGGQQAFNNMQPYLVINFCIALLGTFPSRN